LVRAVSTNERNYVLSPEFIQSYQLAEENYAFPLFHHPPAFVYFSAACYHFLGLPLPLIPLLLQGITLLAILGMCYECHLLVSSPQSRHRQDWWFVAVLAGGLWTTCPITVWCSQKFWIDNMAVMTCTVGIWIHFRLLRSKVLPSWPRMLFSGAIAFGGLILNSKITSFALFPFFLVTIIWKEYEHHYERYRIGTTKKKSDDEDDRMSSHGFYRAVVFPVLTNSIADCICFVIGTGMTQLPWLCWYHVRNCFYSLFSLHYLMLHMML
jgi:hypothetical protein